LAVIGAAGYLVVGRLDGSSEVCAGFGEPTVSEAVNTQGVVGVVERAILASNPLPWGQSASVATRIWGGIVAQRWDVSDRRSAACPDNPARASGVVFLDYRGQDAEWGDGYSRSWYDGTVPEDVVIAVEAMFGPPDPFPIGGADRTMAWVRVMGLEAFVATGAAVAAVVALARARRRRRRDRYLF
jgi:hypothetical protein